MPLALNITGENCLGNWSSFRGLQNIPVEKFPNQTVQQTGEMGTNTLDIFYTFIIMFMVIFCVAFGHLKLQGCEIKAEQAKHPW